MFSQIFICFPQIFPWGFGPPAPPNQARTQGSNAAGEGDCHEDQGQRKEGKISHQVAPDQDLVVKWNLRGIYPPKKWWNWGNGPKKKIGNWPRSKGKFWRNCGKWSYKHDDFTNKNDDFTENVGFNQNTWSFNQERRPNKNNEEISPWKPGFQQPTGNTSCLRR